MQKILPLVTILTLLVTSWSCTPDDDLEGKDFNYDIVNGSKIEVGIKVNTVSTASGFKLLENTFILKPADDLTFLKSNEQKEPAAFIHSLEVYDKTFKVHYKTLDLSLREINGKVVTINVWMPDPNSKQVSINNVGVNVFIDETSIFGFYPKSDITNETYFFSTPNDFENISKVQLPASSYYYNTIRKFGNTILAYDPSSYAENTAILVSQNKGLNWSPLLTIFNGPDRDFLTADFINPNEGWLFTYNYWDSTLVYKVNNGIYNRISCLKGYCVIDSKFLDANKGYIVANTKDNVSPASSSNSYLFKTTNGGLSWGEPILISATERSGKLFVFPSGKIRMMRENSLEMHKSYFASDNDGETWQIVDAGTEGNIRDMYFVSDELGFIKTGSNSLWSQSNYGYVYKTTDGGENWSKIPTVNLLGSKVYFYDEQIGYLQDLLYGKGQVLLVTRDGGNTWKDVLYPYDYLME